MSNKFTRSIHISKFYDGNIMMEIGENREKGSEIRDQKSGKREQESGSRNQGSGSRKTKIRN
jgi:hypothetical protein